MNQAIGKARAASERADAAAEAKRAALADTVIREIEAGRISETEAAKQAGVGRQTVRRWRGQTY